MKKEKFHYYPFWAPRFWHGMALGDWLKLAARNRFAIHPVRWAMAFLITLVTTFNSVMRLVQRAIYGRKLASTRIESAPIFLIGHWRSGTTYLHELFVLDDQFTSPTTAQCFAAHHFLLTSTLLTRVLWFLLPSRRPMDNVIAGWDRPQEDEFALVSLGVPSPYLTIAFPNRPPAYQEYLDMEGIEPAAIERWKAAMRSFLTAVTFQNPKPIILKSPPHTGRIRVLLEMFPDARFVHIVRDPHVLFPSTVRLWKSLYESQAFQWPKHRGLEEFVFASFERMYAAFSRDKSLVDPSRFVEVRYEELVRDPVGQMRAIYEQLNLPGFDRVEPKLCDLATKQREYQTNRYELDDRTRQEIARRWSWYLEHYDYATAPV